MKKGILTAALITILLTSVQIGFTADKSSTTGAALQKAPAFTLTRTDGKPVTLADYKGKVLIVDFWDTWCPPCRMEIPHFIELYTQYRSKGFEMLGVVLGREGKKTVEKFIVDNKINYPNAYSTETFLNAYGPINGIPTTFVIDKKGNIYQTYVGYRDKAVFENDIKALLAK